MDSIDSLLGHFDQEDNWSGESENMPVEPSKSIDYYDEIVSIAKDGMTNAGAFSKMIVETKETLDDVRKQRNALKSPIGKMESEVQESMSFSEEMEELKLQKMKTEQKIVRKDYLVGKKTLIPELKKEKLHLNLKISMQKQRITSQLSQFSDHTKQMREIVDRTEGTFQKTKIEVNRLKALMKKKLKAAKRRQIEVGKPTVTISPLEVAQIAENSSIQDLETTLKNLEAEVSEYRQRKAVYDQFKGVIQID